MVTDRSRAYGSLSPGALARIYREEGDNDNRFGNADPDQLNDDSGMSDYCDSGRPAGDGSDAVACEQGPGYP